MLRQKTTQKVLGALVLAALAGPAGASAQAPLPLGPAGLAEVRTAEAVAPGVTHTRIVRGREAASERWVVDVVFAPTRAAARDARRRLRDAGHRARIERVEERAPDDPTAGPLGFLVRSGRFATEAEATELRTRFVAEGWPAARVVYTGEDGGRTSGPWVVDVLTVAPQAFTGRVEPALGTDVVPGRELLTSLAGRTGALASVNGGYFVIGAVNGTDGDLAGISVVGGELVSEAVDGRTSLVLPFRSGAGATVEALSDALGVRSSDGAARELDGLNRVPGLIRGCGGSGGDLPTEAPKHDFTCTDPSELILYAPVFGPATDPGPGTEAVLDADGRVLELRDTRGGGIPAGGSVLAGTGEAAEWLRAHARVGGVLRVGAAVSGERGPLSLAGRLGVVNGGPRLLRDGAEAITADAEGFHYPENPEFFYRFGARRNPRTLAGIGGDGALHLVTVEGRRPGYSVGASFAESAAILRSLGARDAVNLDGGGSTAMTLGARLLGRPSDATGERPIGDALVVSADSGG